MHDLVLRNGTVVDGTGTPAFEADVAIDGGTITAVGPNLPRGREEIDARGKLVTPGWVDIHTHYDAQVTWDPHLTPSGWHGVTTLVMGNCGVGFAPARPDKHDWLIGLMEGVEDIPGAALTEGIQWGWESFPEYMDAVAAKERAIDVAVQVPHGSVRAYVMGDRGARNEPATADDIERMAAIVREGIAAGALGFSTSRTLIHKAIDGEWVPGTFAENDELFGIGRALGDVGKGVFQMTANHASMGDEFGWMTELSKETGLPVSFNLVQIDEDPELWRSLLDRAVAANAEGANVIPQVAGRPAGVLMGWQCTAHPFVLTPAYMELSLLPIDERLERLRDPEVRKAITTGEPVVVGEFETFVTQSWHKMFALGDPPNYEPPPESSVAAIAEREGRSPQDVAYDLMLGNDGKALLYFPLFNYSAGNMDALHEMLMHPLARISLGDGGAHCGAICDASIPTFVLTHWVRDRSRGARLPLEWAVKRQTRDTAELYGFLDRGLLAPGMRADVNVIDLDRLALHGPEMIFDLPAGGRRLVQRVDGYDATIAGGEVIFRDGVATDARPGSLVRGPRPDPRG